MHHIRNYIHNIFHEKGMMKVKEITFLGGKRSSYFKYLEIMILDNPPNKSFQTIFLDYTFFNVFNSHTLIYQKKKKSYFDTKSLVTQ